MKSAVGWIVAYLCRWLPHSAQTGLYRIGNPDKSSPVLVTGNFSLTVKRVTHSIRNLDVWLLVVNTDGINVWCAACGGLFTANRVVDAVKVCLLSEKVNHHKLILPALAAPGVDADIIKEETGFNIRFGPVYARDIPSYLDNKKKKTEAMRLFDFGMKHRLDMFVSMNLPVYLMAAIILAIFAGQYLAGFTILFWAGAGFFYLFLDYIPGKTGWGQVMISALALVTGWMMVDFWIYGHPFEHWGWLVSCFAILLVAGFDISGTISPRRSDAEMFMRSLGFSSLGSLFVEKNLGQIHLERDICKGCGNCHDICPVGVYAGLDDTKKMTFKNQESCFACGACVKQCPEGALTLI